MDFEQLIAMALLPGRIEIAEAKQTAEKAMAKATVRMAVSLNASAKKQNKANGISDAELAASAKELGVAI